MLSHLGITPALAGNTVIMCRLAIIARDHPRTRGEYGSVNYLECDIRQSPPHSRGIRIATCTWRWRAGITPALAGNTLFINVNCQYSRDHPRTRGEYSLKLFWQGLVSGSPPHSRGILYSPISRPSISGITPALAGNTEMKFSIGAGGRDHPRTRGEYLIKFKKIQW